jgi:hypothetical protein
MYPHISFNFTQYHRLASDSPFSKPSLQVRPFAISSPGRPNPIFQPDGGHHSWQISKMNHTIFARVVRLHYRQMSGWCAITILQWFHNILQLILCMGFNRPGLLFRFFFCIKCSTPFLSFRSVHALSQYLLLIFYCFLQLYWRGLSSDWDKFFRRDPTEEVSFLSSEDKNRFSFRNVVFSRVKNAWRWTKSKNPLILSNIQHRQNPLLSICDILYWLL